MTTTAEATSASANSECRRIFDDSILRIDVLGPVLSAMWFSDKNPTAEDFQTIENAAAENGASDWFLRRMYDRGTESNIRQIWKSPNCPTEWVACENGLKFAFRLEEGASPGLFLDQRLQRKWVQELLTQQPERQVLNLFAYTGGFSVAAAHSGAKSVVTVDLSKNYIEWSKHNFQLNGLSLDGYEFWSVEALRFLEGCVRRGRKFDLIICDPPSFARTSDGVFQIEKVYAKLLDLLVKVAAPEAYIQFSCNLQKWDKREFQMRMNDFGDSRKCRVQFPILPSEFQNSEDCSKIAIFNVGSK